MYFFGVEYPFLVRQITQILINPKPLLKSQINLIIINVIQSYKHIF